MAVNVYFELEKLQGMEGFKSVEKSEGKDGGTYTAYYLNGEQLFPNDGRLVMYVSPDLRDVPAHLRNLVVEVSLHEDFPLSPRRERGMYRHETATCELETGGKESKHIAKVTAERLTDAHEIVRLVKAGKIRPDPSYEGKQSGLSRTELQTELERAQSDAENLKRQLKGAESVAVRYRDCVRLVIKRLREGWLPFCSRKRMIFELNVTIGD